MQPPDHGKRQGAPAVEDFVHAVALPDHRLEIFRRQAGLFHAALDDFHRVWQVDGKRLGIVRLNECDEYIQTVAIRRAEARVIPYEPGNCLERSPVACIGADRADVHGSLHFYGFGIDLVVRVLRM